jgi:hypothetical protein
MAREFDLSPKKSAAVGKLLRPHLFLHLPRHIASF